MMNSGLLMSVFSIGDINTNTPTPKENEEEKKKKARLLSATHCFPSDTHQLSAAVPETGGQRNSSVYEVQSSRVEGTLTLTVHGANSES